MPPVDHKYNLQIVNPILCKQWHPDKNGTLTPSMVAPYSNKKVWWICNKGHEYIALVSNRNKGSGCPYCAGKLVCDNNSLSTLLPDMAEEWHPSKNKNLTPQDVTLGSHKKVWWLCKKGHIWEAQIKSRAAGRGCPKCKSQSSRFEVRLYSELKYIFGRVEWRAKIQGIECDIYLPDYKIGVEIDGMYWHKEKERIDSEKNRKLGAMDVILFRLREKGLQKISSSDIVFREKEPKTAIVALLEAISQHVSQKFHDKIKDYINKSVFANEHEYKKILSCLPSPTPEFSLSGFYPAISSEWDIEKNAPLTPDMFNPFSNQRVWWECKEGHSWDAIISSRVGGRGCPFCAGKKASEKYNLMTLNPKLAAQWHPHKNGPITPSDVVPGSHQRVWWLCENNHEWVAQIKSRNAGSGCPLCAGKILNDRNCLGTLFPEIAKQWHPFRNGELSPHNVHAVSGRKVWWLCEKNHEWESTIANRVYGSGCPCCSRKKASAQINLAVTHPELSKQWHPNKNGDLSPYKVTAGSQKKAWWICESGHEWKAVIGSRTDGRACPYCSGKKVCKDNCLKTINPSLAKEWHPEKNSNLSPMDVTSKSGKKVWWKCKKGHEWLATIANRSNGSGCPFCIYRHRDCAL